MRLSTRHSIAAAAVLACIGAPAALAADTAPAAQPKASQPESPVFAVVNGAPISAREYETTLTASARNKFYHRTPPEAELVAFKREVAERMINRVLLLAEAKRRGTAPDHEKIRETLAGYERQYKDSPRWKADGKEMLPRVQAQLEQQSVLERLEADVRRTRAPSEAESRAYYKAHPDQFTEPEQVRLSVILLKVDPSSPRLAWDKAREEARAIARRIASGADFAELARMHSSDVSSQKGGDLGYLHRGMLPQGLHEEVDKLKLNVASDPVQLLDGIALLKLTDRKSPRPRAFEDVHKRAAELWQREQSEKSWNDFLAGLRSRATIRIDTERYPDLRGEDKRQQAVR